MTAGGKPRLSMCIRDKVSELELGQCYYEITLFYGDGMGAGVADSIRSLFQ